MLGRLPFMPLQWAMNICRESCLWYTCTVDALWYITGCVPHILCVCLHVHMHVCAFMYDCLCVCVCVCVCVSVCRCWYAWNSPVDRVLAYSPAHLGSENLQFCPVVLRPTHFCLVPASQRCCQGFCPSMKCSSVIQFPYMEFHVYSLFLCPWSLCSEVVELLLIQHAY